MKPIVQKDSKEGQVLRMTAKMVDIKKLPNKDILKDIEEMKKALATQPDGVALAAPQISISKRIFVIAPFVFNERPENPQFIFINPEIIKTSSDRKKMDEGCLSVRGKYGKVKRVSRATIRAYNENGEEFTLTGTGLLAQIFQHEIDHLDGILFIDKATLIQEVEYPQNSVITKEDISENN